jgi:hypothetical protein
MLDFWNPTPPCGPGPLHYRGFTITFRHTTFCMTPLDEWSALRRECYLTTHNTHTRHTSMPPTGITPAIPASVRPQTQAVDQVVNGIGAILWNTTIIILWKIYKLIFRTKFKYWILNFKLLSNFCNIPIKAHKKMFISPTKWRADCVFTSYRSFAFITSIEF